MKEIVTSTYSFERMINDDCVYVDKTAYLHKLVSAKETQYFISRPRRYGKSLMISTLKAIFEGRRELFEGLAISETDYDWKPYPVVHLDMSKVKFDNLAQLDDALGEIAVRTAKSIGFTVEKAENGAATFESFWRAVADSGKQVVVLVDEYDVPLQGFIDKPEMFNAVRKKMHDFYVCLKENASDNIKFLMMTGVSKFTKLSIFSGLNNLTDISMVKDYASMLGYTGDEITEYFSEHVKALADEKSMTVDEVRGRMREMYDGYHFSEDLSQAVYNPVSVGSCLRDKSFQNFWMATGQSSLIVELLVKSGKAPMDMESLLVDPAMFNSYDLNSMPTWALLYQGGYLTIKGVSESGNLSLGAPNLEVKGWLNKIYLDRRGFDSPLEFTDNTIDATKCLKNGDVERAIKILRSTLTDYPFSWLINDEGALKVAFVSFFYPMYNSRISSEREMSRGRIDAVWEDESNVYIFEFKYGKSAQEAFDQIIDKEYHLPYLEKGKRVVGVGLNWNPNKENRGLDAAVMAELKS